MPFPIALLPGYLEMCFHGDERVSARMDNCTEFTEQRKQNRTRKHWNQTRKRGWEESTFASLAAKHADLFNGIFDETSVSCLRRIAENSSVPTRMLDQLSEHPSPLVREAVADNPNTPADVLWVLASDECMDIRYAMAENHNIPLAILWFLTEDQNPYVSCRATSTINRLIGGTLFSGNFGGGENQELAVG